MPIIQGKQLIKLQTVSVVLLFQLFVYQIVAQDLHYSQFQNSPLNLNPALTGVFNGARRYNLSVRDQWRFVPVPWFTFSGAFDANKIREEKNYFFGYGVNFNYDRQGSSRLVLSALNLSGSITRILNKNNLISGGILLGGARRGFNLTNLTWDKQWTGDAFDPTQSSGENFNLQALTFVETGAGVNYRLQKDNRTNIDLGVSGLHLYQPRTNFYNTPSKRLPLHLAFNAMASLKVLPSIDLLANALYQKQTVYNETVVNGSARFYINKKRGKELTVDLGLGYRTAGSLFPIFAIGVNNWYLSGSYDLDRTNYNSILNSNRGGPEIHLRYIFKPVPAMNDRKVCPIY